MKQILFDFLKNRHGKINRCLGLLSFLIVITAGHKSFAQDYCTPIFTEGCQYSYISDFKIYGSGIEHTSSGCSTDGYGDFTGTSGLQGSLQQGETYTFIKTAEGLIKYQQMRIWIDFNGDGDFEDDGELLFSSTFNETTTIGSFTIPLTAAVTSSTRLRIIANYNNLPVNSCTGGNYGETQDYTVEILAAPSCQSPFAVNTFTSTNYSNIDWTSQGSAFQIEWGTTGFTTGNGTLISDITSTSYTINGLTSNTAYQFYIRQNCGDDGYGNWSGPYSFTTTIPGQVGDGNEFTTTYFPIAGWNESYSYSQQIYLANELKAVLDENATFITKIRFKPVTLGENLQNIENWTVYLGNTTKSSFANTTDWVAYSDLEYVFSGNLTFEEGEWVEIELDIPFAWDGVSNLVVAVDENSSGSSPGTSFAAFYTGINRGISHYSNDNPNPVLLPSTNDGSPQPIIAQIQIEAIEAPACNTTALNAQSTLTTAFVSWTSTGNSFEVVYGENGFIIGEGDTIADITTTNTTLSGLTPDTHYDYYVRQDCGGEEILTGPYTFYTGYCVGEATGINHKIIGFSTSEGYENIANLDNGLNLYTNYSDTIYVSQSEGESFNYSIDVTDFTYVKFWVDWNNNLLFEEDELIAEHQFTTFSSETHTGTISIPENTPEGNYRLRIRTGSQSFDACNMSDGEIEDYTIAVVTPPSCVPPTGLTANNITLNSAELSWTSTSSLFNIEYGESGFILGEGNLINGVSNTYTITELEQDKNYSYYVQADCGSGDTSFWAGPYSFYTGYCVAYTDLLEFGMIEGFSTQNGYINISNLDNGYEDNGYSDYTEHYVTLSEGSAFIYNVNIMDGMLAEIWIDWNQNLIFDEAELVAQLFSGSYTGEIMIPFGTPEGDYRLRLRSRSDFTTPSADPCGGIIWIGETEDYTITVVTPPSCLPVINLGSTNISATSTSLFWQSSGGEYFDIEYGQDGFEQGTGTFVSEVGNPHTLTGLINGVNYQYYVRQNCGNDDYSIWRGPFKFNPGVYLGNIPTFLNENPTVDDEACSTTFNIEVPQGQQIANINVQYSMLSTSSAWTSQQRSVLYSPSLGLGEDVVVAGVTDFPGIQPYDRNVTFANGSTGIVEFELKAWRTTGGTGCGTDLIYVVDGTWILTPEFEDIPTCPDPATDLSYSNITEDSVDLIWEAESGSFQIIWDNAEFDPETEGTLVSGITTNSYTLSGLDSSVLYEFYVRRDCSSEEGEDFGEWVGPVQFNPGYCLPSVSIVHYFTQFYTTNAIDNIIITPTPGVGYVNSTSMVIGTEAGGSFNFTSNYIGGASGLRIWIDWNNDYIFEDSEEVFYQGSANGNKSGVITIPSDALSGDYRIRVRGQAEANSVPSSCGQSEYGQTIDFTLSIPCGEVSSPVGSATQTFTSGSTLSDLSVDGSNLVWYSDSALTDVLDDTTLLVDGTTYYVVNLEGNCSSSSISVTVSEVLSSSDFTHFGFGYHPNPVSEVLYLRANTDIKSVVVFNILGQELSLPIHSNNTQIDMTGLPSGNYVMSVTIEGVNKTF